MSVYELTQECDAEEAHCDTLHVVVYDGGVLGREAEWFIKSMQTKLLSNE